MPLPVITPANLSQRAILGATSNTVSGAVPGATWYAVSDAFGALFQALSGVVASIISGAGLASPRGKLLV